MIKSMTAFASGETEIDNLLINCELRSVNHRYCDLSLKIPERLRFIEAELRPAITQKIKRGKIECALSYKKSNTNQQDLSINFAAVDALLSAANDIAQRMNQPHSFSALDVLNFPGIQQEPETDKLQLQQTILTLVDSTITQLLESRRREGEQLAHLIEERCATMQKLVHQANQRMPEVLAQIKNKLKDRVSELVNEPDQDRLEQEIVYLSQKLDVAEELDRLETHITEVQRVLKQKEPVGRRLDFLMQEMNREANTLGSKSADKEMTQISIELKVLIEQMREQVQNIE